MGSPIYLFVPFIRKCQRYLESIGQGTGHKNDRYIIPFSYCNNYIKLKNALMSEIITEERYKIYKICNFSKKMAYRQRN